jgi:hypothetical protein
MAASEDPSPEGPNWRQKFLVLLILLAAILCAALSVYAIAFRYR